MALEVIRDLKEIGGFEVKAGHVTPDPRRPIAIFEPMNVISFKLQRGPIREEGVNGCQVDTLIETAREIIKGLNEKYHHAQNVLCLEHLTQALEALNRRTKEREERGVEGTNAV